MGNVSQVLPAIHPMLTFRGKQAPAHNPAFTEIAASAEADESILDGAATMAATVLDVALNPELRAELVAGRSRRDAPRHPSEPGDRCAHYTLIRRIDPNIGSNTAA